MEPGTLEKKIAKLPENLKIEVEEYIDALLNSEGQSMIAAEPEVKYQTSSIKTGSDSRRVLMEKLEKLSPGAQIEVEKSIEKLLGADSGNLNSKTTKPRAKFGELAGFVTYIADDFDAPLEEFKDYM